MAIPASGGTRPSRIVVLSPMAALESPSTAGGLLLSRIVASHLAVGARVIVLAPWMRRAASELERTSPVAETLLLGRPRDRRGIRRALLTLAHRIMPAVQRLDPHLPWLPLVVDLLTDPVMRRLLRGADVIDLQWEEYGRLGPFLRRIAPRAARVCTFHDVTSQRLGREALRAEPGPASRRAERRTAAARRTERRLAASLDMCFVLSGKDERLLRAGAPRAPITVVNPPLVDAGTPLADARSRPLAVGFVSYLRRHENRDAALRLAERIWPTVLETVPDARLLIIGGGAEEGTRRRLRAVPGVELTGFVEDLEAAYAALRVTVSPIDRGAGVKFKVVESIVRGLPTLTTPVGAEGIDPELFTVVSDDDQELAARTVAALLDPEVSARAHDAARSARTLFGIGAFHEAYQQGIRSAAARDPAHRRRRHEPLTRPETRHDR